MRMFMGNFPLLITNLWLCGLSCLKSTFSSRMWPNISRRAMQGHLFEGERPRAPDDLSLHSGEETTKASTGNEYLIDQNTISFSSPR